MPVRLLQLIDVSMSHGKTLPLSGVSVDIYCGDRLTIVGRRGKERSLLAKIIAGEELPDSGHVSSFLSCSRTYIPPKFIFDDSSKQVIEVLTRFHNEKKDLFGRLNNLEEKLARNVSSQEQIVLLQEWQMCRDKARQENCFDFDKLFAKITKGLRVNTIEMSASLLSLPKEEQSRVLLASLLLQTPDILVLDEPTHHLDAVSLRWFEEYLRSYFGAVVVVSKDEKFLDSISLEMIKI